MHHIIGGFSAAGSLRQALPRSSGHIYLNEDMLSCGPAIQTDDLKTWRSHRERFVREIYGEPEYKFGIDNETTRKMGLIDHVERLLVSNEQATIWVGVGLADQLFLAWILFFAEKLAANLNHIRVNEIEDIGTGIPVFGTGELSPKYFRLFENAAVPLSKAQVSDYSAAWHAYTSSSPIELVNFFNRDIASSSLKTAMKVLIGRYPSTTSGLSRLEESFLKYTIEKGPRVVSVIANAIGWEEHGDRVGDLYLLWRLRKLADIKLNAPLLILDGDATDMRNCDVTLSAFGQKVADGAANAYEINGIDDWVGGVHLSGKSPIAVCDGDRLKILD